MIRPFENLDLRRLKPNEFSEPYDMDFIFGDPETIKFSQVDDKSEVLCIMASKRYWQDNWLGFFLISQNYRPSYAKELKKFFHQGLIDMGAKRIQTDSVACPLLDKWHRFLNFELEGTRRKMIHGKDYNLWGMVR